jgi:hypothetical protein
LSLAADRHIKQLERMLQHRQKRIDAHEANSFVKSERNTLVWTLNILYELYESKDTRLFREQDREAPYGEIKKLKKSEEHGTSK